MTVSPLKLLLETEARQGDPTEATYEEGEQNVSEISGVSSHGEWIIRSKRPCWCRREVVLMRRRRVDHMWL